MYCLAIAFQTVWTYRFTVSFDREDFNTLKHILGNLFFGCLKKDTERRMSLMFTKKTQPTDEKMRRYDLKSEPICLIAALAYNCVFDAAGLGVLGMRCLFNARNKLETHANTIKNALYEYLKNKPYNEIIKQFKACVDYIRAFASENINSAEIINARVKHIIHMINNEVIQFTSWGGSVKMQGDIDKLCREGEETRAMVQRAQASFDERFEAMKKQLNKIIEKVEIITDQMDKLDQQFKQLQETVSSGCNTRSRRKFFED